MSLQLILGPSGSGKTHRIYEDCIKRSMEHPELNFYIIVPEQMTLTTQQELFMMHPCHGSLNIDVIGFTTLAYRVFEELHVSLLEMIDETGRMMLLRRAIEKVKPHLQVLQCDSHKIDYIDKIRHTLDEFSKYCQLEAGSALRKLLKEDQKSDEGAGERYYYLKNKLNDLLLIWEAYQEEIHQRYMDKDQLFPLLIEYMSQSEVLKNSECYIDGFHYFTPLQSEVLRNLLSLCPKVTIALMSDGTENPNDSYHLFYQPACTARDVRNLARDQETTILEDITLYHQAAIRFRKTPALAHLEHFYGRTNTSIYAGPVQGLWISARQNPVDELKKVFQQVDDLVKKQGYRYSEIAIVTDCLDQYTEIARRMLATTDIPYFVDATHKMLDNRYVAFQLSLLKVLARGFFQDDILACLKYDFILTREEVDSLENHVVRFHISGEKRWKEPLHLERLDEESITGEDLKKKVYEKLQPMYDKLAHGRHPVNEYIKELREFARSIDMETKLVEIMQYLEEHGMHDIKEEYRMVWERTEVLFDQCTLLLGEEEVTADEMTEILESGFNDSSFGIIPPTLDRLVIGDMRRSRINKVRALFILGANEGSFPKNHDKTGILSNGDRELLRRVQIELDKTAEEESIQDRFMIYRMLTKPSENLYISYSGMDTEGKVSMAAGAVTDIRALFEKNRIPNNRIDNWINPTYAVENLFAEASTSDEKAIAMLAWLSTKKEYHLLLEKILSTANFEYYPEKLEAELVEKLYPSGRGLSASRLESYSSCQYKYFLNYGLGIKERASFDVTRLERGDFFHAVMDYFLKTFATDEEFKAKTLEVFTDYEDRGQKMNKELFLRLESANAPIVKKAMEYASKKVFQLDEKIESSDFYHYLWEVWEEEAMYLFRVMEYQNYLGAFSDFYSEEPFKDENTSKDFFRSSLQIPDSDCRINGTVDRFDLTDPKQKNIYVRIFDYKSTKKELSFEYLKEGIQFQLPLYLHTVVDHFKQLHKDVTPVGMYYFKAGDDNISLGDVPNVEDDAFYETYWKEICKAAKLSGITNSSADVERIQEKDYDGSKSLLLNNYVKKNGEFSDTALVLDTEEFERLSQWLMRKTKDIHKAIASGDIKINPYRRSDNNNASTPCDYCSYKGICKFDTQMRGFAYRELSKMNLREFKEATGIYLEEDQDME